MDSRIAHHKGTLTVATFIVIFSGITNAKQSCKSDGLQVDYNSGCREYFKCDNGSVTFKFLCSPGRIYSYSAYKCIVKKKSACVHRKCSPADTLAYVSPGSKCREYYRCVNGIAVDAVCPYGTWFDFERQACTRGSGACYEPVCAGRVDGYYADTTHDCRRLLHCKGGELKSVMPCEDSHCLIDCPHPRTSSVSLPVGDVEFCTDTHCSSLCIFKKDGAYADISTGCKEFYVCSQSKVVHRGVCEPGTVFSNGGCISRAYATCSAPSKGRCFGLNDGLHRDWKDCRSWFTCLRDKVVTAGTCNEDYVWDGESCVPKFSYLCEGPRNASECIGRPSGFYQDLDWNCTRYYRCENGARFTFSCPSGYGFDGDKCSNIDSFTCPNREEETCYRKQDGKYFMKGSGCRSYYRCTAGEKSIYTCSIGQAFNGYECVEARTVVCPFEEKPCLRLKDGYHQDINTKCRRYFYCESGERLASFECFGDRVFDGKECVEESNYACGKPRTISDGKCDKDGFFLEPHSSCRKYYFCIADTRTLLRCDPGKLFNGAVCVPEYNYTCNDENI